MSKQAAATAADHCRLVSFIYQNHVHSSEHLLLGAIQVFLGVTVITAEAVASLLLDKATLRLFWYSGFWTGFISLASGLLSIATAKTKLRFVALFCALMGSTTAIVACVLATFSILEVMRMESSYEDALFRNQLQPSLIIGYITNGVFFGASAATFFTAIIQIGYTLNDLFFTNSRVAPDPSARPFSVASLITSHCLPKSIQTPETCTTKSTCSAIVHVAEKNGAETDTAK